MEKIIQFIADAMWGGPMIILLLGTHLFLTFRLKFIQRYIFKGIKLSFSKDDGAAGEVSPFGSLSVALAATIGTGNIVGVATAVTLGGPGAVFWMWITGVFGIATKYAEAVLSIKYRVQNSDGSFSGGPMYTLERGLHSKALGIAFAMLTAIAAFGIGCSVQSNSIASLMSNSFAVPTWITGIILAFFTALVIIGGIKSISKICTFFVPFLAIFYILGCIYILLYNYATVPDTIALIIKSAFTGQAAVGGFVGAGVFATMRMGIARGLFSNESGMGSAPIVAAAARTKTSVRQGLVSATGTFWDTVVVCALTGLVVVNSGTWHEGLNGAALTSAAFAQIPYVGTWILNIALLTFVFSTIVGWYYYGEKSIEYLFGSKSILTYKILWVAVVYAGSVLSLSMVWNLADIANALMAIPNVIALIFLSNVIVKETDTHLWQKKENDEK